MIYMTFLGGVFAPSMQEKEQEAGPKHPLKGHIDHFFRRAQIRWVIWRSSRESAGVATLSISGFWIGILVALYRAMRLRFGYGFESCEANGPRNVKNTNIAKHRPIFFPHFSLLVVRNWSWKCLNEGNFTLRFVWQENAAIRVPKLH